MSLAEFKALVREQFHILLIDEDAALKAIPAMLPADRETRIKAFGIVQQVLGARGKLSDDDQKRLEQVSRLFGLEGDANDGFAERQRVAKRSVSIVPSS
jgi:hypothetical protein